MNTHRPGRFDRHTAEQLLRGERARGANGKLGDLLDAAAAPPRARELPGERAALAAFRAAHRASAPLSRERYRGPLRRHLSLKLALAVAALLGLGGTAAAVTGTLPAGLIHGLSPNSTTPISSSAPTHGSRPTESYPGATRSVQDLCHRYSTEHGDDHTLDTPEFGPLVHAAGGKRNVPAYCIHQPGSSWPEQRQPTRSPADHFNGWPDQHGGQQVPQR